MKILVDMNLSPSWVSYLNAAGFDAVHWSTIGPLNAPDSELMKWASDRGYIVLTADLDFGAILAVTQGTRARNANAPRVSPGQAGKQAGGRQAGGKQAGETCIFHRDVDFAASQRRNRTRTQRDRDGCAHTDR